MGRLGRRVTRDQLVRTHNRHPDCELSDPVVDSAARATGSQRGHGRAVGPGDWPVVASLLHHDGVCSVMPKGAFPPGILLIGHGYGHERTTDIETDVVAFLQDWLSSSHADNARQSLAGENGVRCAVLVASMDG